MDSRESGNDKYQKVLALQSLPNTYGVTLVPCCYARAESVAIANQNQYTATDLQVFRFSTAQNAGETL